ncbi:MAG: VWA domain-containing protein [Mailhella sp.]|nr:VWA domain-containing protein [Mailhella sp.]
MLPQLLRQRETRKILLVFTDGAPDSCETAERALHDAKALGVEVYAVSYRDVAAKRLFGEQNCTVIASIDELPGAFTNMLLGALRRAA